MSAGRTIIFSFEGRALRAPEGQTVASALVAHGVSVFGRSSKYHRPRGYRCGRGHCSCCSMHVDGLPGVRTCVTTVRQGMCVEREHSWPTADHDALRAAELLSPLMPPGFYYRRFRRSPRLWGALERGLARAAGQGRMPSAEAVVKLAAARCRRRDGLDVLVVGGGVAGMSAALAAADEGAGVLLLQRSHHLGGRSADDSRITGVARLLKEVVEHEAIEVRTGAEASGWYEEGTVAVDMHPDLLLVNPSAVVLATGAYELGVPFPNCDLPGVMLTSAAQRLLGRYRVRPGATVALVTSDDLAYAAGLQFVKAGIEVACVADYRRAQQIDHRAVRDLASRGVTVLAEVRDVRAKGFDRVKSLSLRDAAGVSRRYRCEAVCISAGFRAADELARQALSGGNVTLSMPVKPAGAGGGSHGLTPSGPWLAGQVGGASSFATAVEQGDAAGRAAALRAKGLA